MRSCSPCSSEPCFFHQTPCLGNFSWDTYKSTSFFFIGCETFHSSVHYNQYNLFFIAGHSLFPVYKQYHNEHICAHGWVGSISRSRIAGSETVHLPLIGAGKSSSKKSFTETVWACGLLSICKMKGLDCLSPSWGPGCFFYLFQTSIFFPALGLDLLIKRAKSWGTAYTWKSATHVLLFPVGFLCL